MAKVGRPPKIKETEMPELVRKFEEYIDNTEIPILAEFAYQNNVTRPWLYDQQEFSTLIKKCIDKKEVALERGTLNGTLQPTMAVFSLKQLGWKDRESKIVFVDPKTLTDKELRELIDNGGQ